MNNLRQAAFRVAYAACFSVITAATLHVARAQNLSSADASPPSVITPRAQRAEAYAKLLEGQRRLMNVGNDPSELELRRVRQSFQQAALLDPALAEAHTALAGIAFFYSSDLTEATREAAIATRLNPDNFGAHRILSRSYALLSGLQNNKPNVSVLAKAIAETKEVARLQPADAEAWALLGEFYDAIGRTNEAISAYTRWLAAPPAADSSFFQFISGGDTLAADAAAARLGQALLRAQRPVEAANAFRRAISLAPKKAEYLELLGQAFEAGAGTTADAIAELQRLVAADPTNTAALELLARTLVRAKRFDDAVAILRTGISKHSKPDADSQRLRLALAQTYTDASRYDEAIGVYEDFLKERGISNTPLAAPQQKELATILLNQIANLQRSAKRFAAALATVERMRRVLGADDSSADVQYAAIAEALARLGRKSEALTLLRAALQRPNLTSDALIAVSAAQDSAGDLKGSEESLRRVLAKEPGNAVALNNLGFYLLERNERLPEALALIQRAVRAQPANPSFLDSLGWAFFKNGKLDEAERSLIQAAQRDAANPTIQDHLGDVYQKQNQRARARAAWQKALTLTTEPSAAARIKAKLDGKTN